MDRVTAAVKPNRRAVLAGLASLLPSAACAGAPAEAPRPPARPADFSERPESRAVVASAGLLEETSFALADLETGEIIDSYQAGRARPPASVVKAVTAHYALGTLGPAHRFRTRVLATGPIVDGVLEGDLVLAGGGDPALDTDALAALVEQLKERGLVRVGGRFIIDDGLQPLIEQIDPEQPAHVGYNPSVAALNLNYNRVLFEWDRKNGARETRVEARALRNSPAVDRVRVEVVPQQSDVFSYRRGEGGEVWSVLERALGREGGRWLPVRSPAAYGGEVFRALAAAEGLSLPPAVAGRASTGAVEIAAWRGAPLTETVRGMLKHSTNLTAEALGLAATRRLAEPHGSLRESAAAMCRWTYGTEHAVASTLDLRNHSGLSGASRITPVEMATILRDAARTAPAGLPTLLKELQLAQEGTGAPIRVAAKTGTMNFIRGLGGYLTPPGGRPLVFAIFAADPGARDLLAPSQRERPRGGRAWLGRARAQERALLRLWARQEGTA